MLYIVQGSEQVTETVQDEVLVFCTASVGSLFPPYLNRGHANSGSNEENRIFSILPVVVPTTWHLYRCVQHVVLCLFSQQKVAPCFVGTIKLALYLVPVVMPVFQFQFFFLI